MTKSTADALPPLPRRAVLAGTDLSEAGGAAIVEADAWAREHDAPLVVCHALARPDAIRPLFPHLFTPTVQRGQLEVATDAVQRQVHELTGRNAGDYAVTLDAGSPHAVIVGAAEACEPRLVVVGRHDKGMAERFLTGSTSDQVVRHAPAPVLVAREPSGQGPVVAATDLSEWGAPAIAAAGEVARRRNARLVVIHAIDVTPSLITALDPQVKVDDQVLDVARGAARDLIAAHLERFGHEGRAEVVTGPTVASVLAVVYDLNASLLVVASQGGSQLRRLAIGSVAEALVRNARCSVLVARG